MSPRYLLDKAQYFIYRGYHPHPGQTAIHASPARHRVVVAGRRSGKTLLAAREAECVLLQHNKRVWIVAPTHDLTDRVFREIWETFIENPRTRCQVRRKAWSAQHRVIHLGNGSFVEGKTAHTPTSLVGEGLDLLIFDEAAKADPLIWERYLRPTLSDRKGRALFITTPEGRNWIYDLWKRGLQPDDGELGSRAPRLPAPEWASFRFESAANPMLDRKEIEQARRELSEEAFAQEYLAQFITFAAQVYKEFDELLHVRPCGVIPDWPVYRAMDFGYRNPFVCLWIQVDPEDRLRIIGEYYATGRTTAENAEALLAYEETQGFPKARQSFCDPSAAEPRQVLRQLGIPTRAHTSRLNEGIERIRGILRPRADGTPGLIVTPQCVQTLREFNLYRYPGEGDYSAEPGAGAFRATPEVPLKIDDHCMDALRYAVMGLCRPSPPGPIPKPAGW